MSSETTVLGSLLHLFRCNGAPKLARSVFGHLQTTPEVDHVPLSTQPPVIPPLEPLESLLDERQVHLQQVTLPFARRHIGAEAGGRNQPFQLAVEMFIALRCLTHGSSHAFLAILEPKKKDRAQFSSVAVLDSAR